MCTPVATTICTSLRSPICCCMVMSRPRSMVVRSTSVRTPTAAARESSATAFSTSAGRSKACGQFSSRPGETIARCSWKSVTPRSSGATSPVTVEIAAIGILRRLPARVGDGLYGSAFGGGEHVADVSGCARA